MPWSRTMNGFSVAHGRHNSAPPAVHRAHHHGDLGDSLWHSCFAWYEKFRPKWVAIREHLVLGLAGWRRPRPDRRTGDCSRCAIPTWARTVSFLHRQRIITVPPFTVGVVLHTHHHVRRPLTRPIPAIRRGPAMSPPYSPWAAKRPDFEKRRGPGQAGLPTRSRGNNFPRPTWRSRRGASEPALAQCNSAALGHLGDLRLACARISLEGL